MVKGKLIALEGLDGSGKHTQAQLLAKNLDGIVLSFPNYNTETGNIIESFLKESWSAKEKGYLPMLEEPDLLNAYILQCLMTVNRLEFTNVIQGHIAMGKTVILDRYYASAIVYGQADGLPKSWLERIHATLPEPDHWVYLDTPVSESFARRPQRRDVYESDRFFLEKAKEKYLELFNQMGINDTKWHIVDGLGSEEQVQKRIVGVIKDETT